MYLVKGVPVPGGHVECVGGSQLEVDGRGVQVDGERVKEGGLRVLPELQHGGQDGVPPPGLLLQVVEATAAAVAVGRVGHVVGRGAPHSGLNKETRQ